MHTRTLKNAARSLVWALFLLACRDDLSTAPKAPEQKASDLQVVAGRGRLTGDGFIDVGTLGGQPPQINALSMDGTIAVGSVTIRSTDKGTPDVSYAVRWNAFDGLQQITEGWAKDVSDDGTVVIGNVPVPVQFGVSTRAFRWSHDRGLEVIESPAGGQVDATAISADGHVIVGNYIDEQSHQRGFRWSIEAGFQDLGAGGMSLIPMAVSFDGNTIAGDVYTGAGWRAFKWTASGGVQVMEEYESNGRFISARGDVIVGYAFMPAGGSRTFRWTSAGVEILPVLSGNSSYPSGMDDQGTTVVGRYSNASFNDRAFLWTVSGGTQDLGSLGGPWTYANAVSGNGDVVIGASVSTASGVQRYRPFKWTASEGLQELPMPDITWSGHATMISRDGRAAFGQISGPDFTSAGVLWTNLHGDDDRDGIPDDGDNCPGMPNPAQRDSDHDGIGDECDPTPWSDVDGDGMIDDIDNCINVANADQADDDGDGIGNECDPSAPGETPPGSDVTVTPVDLTTGTTPVSLSFGNVTSGGTTTVTTSGTGTPPASGFRLGNPPVYYDIHTTATFNGVARVCINYGNGFRNESQLKLLHREASGAWTDVTTSLDVNANIICGAVTSFSPFTVAEANRLPVITGVTLPLDPQQVGANVSVAAQFTDADAGDSHQANVEWGDGSSSAGVVGPGTVSASHTYATPGVYTVTVRVGDAAGGSATAVARYVVVYDPTGAFVTGGGWIDSPTGAFVASPSLAGKASFGFVAKYQKGANVPTGDAEFQFKVANLAFRSTSYEWLVVAGTRAQFKGEGTINGAGRYGFMLTGIDGGSADAFRIKIWDVSSGAVVYDNKAGAADDAADATLLGGGSIVIHR